MKNVITLFVLSFGLSTVGFGQTHTPGFPKAGTPSEWIYSHSTPHQNTTGSNESWIDSAVYGIPRSVWGSSSTGDWATDFVATYVTTDWVSGYPKTLVPNQWCCTHVHIKTQQDTDSLDYTRPARSALRYYDYAPIIVRVTNVGSTQAEVEASPW